MERTLALCIAYDGTDFVGSQWQKVGRSVQGELERAWTQLSGETVRWHFAGRTDRGVHANGQIAHVRTASSHDLNTIVRALNALTAADLSVSEAWEMPPSFHARFSARQRAYRYLLHVAPTPNALLRRHAVSIVKPLNVAAMEQGLTLLHGEHDFAAFAGGGQTGSTVRQCYAARLESASLLGHPVIAVGLIANGFLRHMVRNIVGTLLLVGEERLSVDEMQAIIRSGDRTRAGPTAPAHGLYLEWVSYDSALAPLAISDRWDGRICWRDDTQALSTVGTAEQPPVADVTRGFE